MRPIISTLHTANAVTNMTGTTKTQLGGGSIILPAWCKSIFVVVPQALCDTTVAAVGLNTVCELESNDLSLMPYQVLPAPLGSLLGTINSIVAKPEKYQVGAPCGGGEQINVYGTCLVTPGSTLTAYMGATLIVSNMQAGYTQRHAKIGTVTTSGTTATSDVAGTRYNFSSAKHIIELMGNLTPTTRAAADGIAGYFKFTSNEFDGVADVKLPFTPICGGIATMDTAYIDGTSRLPVDIPVTPGQVNIQDYLYMGLAPGAAGNFITGVIYE